MPTESEPKPTLREALVKARGLVARGWVQRRETNDEGTAFCARGALRSVVGRYPFMYSDAVMRLGAAMDVSNGNITLYNDTHTRAEVLDAFDRAIAAVAESNAIR